MQKTYMPDSLMDKKEKNCGQVEGYIVENAYETIIGREMLDMVHDMKGHIGKRNV